MPKDKARPPAPQLLLPSAELREKFRLWHQRFREPQERGGNPIEKLSRSEAVQAFLRAQATEQESKPTTEQAAEQAPQRRKRQRHRPPLNFPHFPEAMTALEQELVERPSLRNSPKQEAGWVMNCLRGLGDAVENKHERTIIRRVADWRDGKR